MAMPGKWKQNRPGFITQTHYLLPWLTSPSVCAIFQPLQHPKPKHCRTSLSANKGRPDGASSHNPNMVSRQNSSVPGSVMYHLNEPNCQDWGRAVLTPPVPVTCSPQLPSEPRVPAPSSCLDKEREVGEPEGEKGHWCKEGMRKVSWRKWS